jgi:hypothetical protein
MESWSVGVLGYWRVAALDGGLVGPTLDRSLVQNPGSGRLGTVSLPSALRQEPPLMNGNNCQLGVPTLKDLYGAQNSKITK